MASQIRDKLNIAPITAGAMSSTSVENFITYRLSIRYMYPAPMAGAPKAKVVDHDTLSVEPLTRTLALMK